MRVVIDSKRCIGAGACVLAADAIFDLSEEGVVQLVRQPTPDEEARARDAVRACPTGAIEIVED